MATTKKKPSAAQLAARAKFAAAAKAGTLRKNPVKRVARKTNPIVSGYNHLSRADLIETFGDGNVKFKRNGEIHVYGKMPNTNKNGWYLHSFSVKTDKPKRAANPIKNSPKTQTIKGVKYTRKHGSTSVKYPFTVEAEGPAGFSGVGGFTSFNDAEVYAKAYAKMAGVRVRVMG